MFSNLIFSYSRWFFIPPNFAFYDLSNVAGTLAGEDQDRKVIEYLSHFLVSGITRSPISFLHVFLSLLFIIEVPIAAFLVALVVPGQI